jgi:hypothetical protein
MPFDGCGDRRIDADVVDVFGTMFYVSTIAVPTAAWIGALDRLAHAFGYAEPAPYETMIFRRDWEGTDLQSHSFYTERYQTAEDAVAGHARIVAAIEETVGRGRAFALAEPIVSGLLDDEEGSEG